MPRILNAGTQCAALAWLLLAAPCFGTAVISVGDYVLQANQAAQPVQIFVSGGEQVQGLNLYVQVADGGVFAGGTATGPTISSVDILTGTIFATSNTGQRGGADGPLFWEASTTTRLSPSFVTADGLLATVFIDTTGIFSGTFALRTDPPLANSDFADPGISVAFINGSITVPEPSTVLVGLIGVACLAGCVHRRGMVGGSCRR